MAERGAVVTVRRKHMGVVPMVEQHLRVPCFEERKATADSL